jgi:predicted dehydrogenase
LLSHQLNGPTGIDLLFAGQMLFPGEVIAQFDCSFITMNKVAMEITGDKARITIPAPFKPGEKTNILIHSEGHTKTISIKGQQLYQGEIEDLENAILNGKAPRISLDDSRGNIAVIEALYQSAQSSKLVSIRNV